MILATGAAGMTGRYLPEIYPVEQLYLTDIRESPGIHHMDVRDKDEVFDVIGSVKPKLVIHLAAETNVDLCEQKPDHAYQTNFFGTQNIALCCARHAVELAYVSTAGVFGGRRTLIYTEFDDPQPINTYASSKLEGERAVQRLVPFSYVARAGWMFGGSVEDKKFVGKIAQQCLDQLPHPHLKAVSDKFGSPTYARDFLAQLKVLSESGCYGLYHLVNRGAVSRYDVAVEIVKLLGLEDRALVDAVKSDVFPLPAARPDSEAARNYKLELLGVDRMRHWKEALADYLSSWQVQSGSPLARATGVGR